MIPDFLLYNIIYYLLKEVEIMNKVGLYAICKNESKFVDTWIENMIGADYICVLDTGSTDDTFDKLKEYQTKYPEKIFLAQKEITPWRFDTARNESMKLVPEDANILVCTDLDEKFDNTAWADILRLTWNDTVDRGFYKYAWSHNSAGEGTDVFMYDKIHSRRYYWKYPVHEVLWPTIAFAEGEKEKGLTFTEFTLHHYPDLTKPRKYYFDLLKLAVEENPEDCHEHLLLAREYLLNKDLDTALKEYLFTLQMPNIDNSEFEYVLLDALSRVADIYRQQKNFDEAIWYCNEFIRVNSTYREPYYLLAEIYNEMKLYTLAEAMVTIADKCCTRHYTWVERSTTWTSWGADLMSVSCYHQGRYDEAIMYSQEVLKHDNNNVQALQNYGVFLQSKLTELEAQMKKVTD